MELGMVPKVYEVDYGFIVKNYLNEELWNKEWNIYSYKDLRFTIMLYRIDCFDKSICFQVKVYNDKESYTNSDTFWFYKTQENFKVLQRQINGKIYSLMESYELYKIRKSEGYNKLSAMFVDEDDNLKEIAESYLDDNGVTNEDIRDVYIDNYVSNNRKKYNALESFKDLQMYLIIPDYYLTFLESVKDEERLNKVRSKLRTHISEEEYNEIMEQAKKVSEFDEEYRDEMIDELEAL